MKTRYLGWATAGVLVLAGVWFGRSAWRAHHHLVTLRVRNAPLAEVIRKLEQQTHEKIPFDKRLDTRVTLDLKNKPLSLVLDRLVQQCGARWSTVYAVYDSASALKALESALRGDQKLDEAGWKIIAPAALASPAAAPHMPMFDGPNEGPKPGGMVVAQTEDVQVAAPAQPGAHVGPPPQGQPVVRVFRRHAGDDNSPMEDEIWSATQLMVPSPLVPRLKKDFSFAASPEAAAEAARDLKGNWKTYYVLKKSQLGMGFPGLHGVVSAQKIKSPGGPIVGPGPGGVDPAELFRRRKLDELGLLTPEQRVQRAREHKALAEKR
jgi:hypothetical protein